jgi:hypothetical protein
MGVLGLVCACNSPTLPTPPPDNEPPQLDIPSAQLRSDGEHVDVAGYALAGTTVIALNRSLLDTNVNEASSVAVASLDDGKYTTTIRVDLRCAPKNTIDIFQRDSYGRFSPARTFQAPNGFEADATAPPPDGTGCTDAGPSDASAGEGGDGSSE